MNKVWMILGAGVVAASIAACSSDSDGSSSTTGAGGGTTSTTTTGTGGAGGGTTTATTTTTGAGGSGGGAAAAPCHDVCSNNMAPTQTCLDCFNEKKAEGGPCFDADQACTNDTGGGMMGCSTCAQLLAAGEDPPCPGSADLADALLGCICTPDACGP